MISRKMKDYELQAETTTVDSIGQVVKEYSTLRTIKGSVFITEYKEIVEGIQHLMVGHVCLTDDKNIPIGARLTDGSTIYEVEFTNPSGRYNKLHLKELK